jgi:hypothetical protein
MIARATGFRGSAGDTSNLESGRNFRCQHDRLELHCVGAAAPCRAGVTRRGGCHDDGSISLDAMQPKILDDSQSVTSTMICALVCAADP